MPDAAGIVLDPGDRVWWLGDQVVAAVVVGLRSQGAYQIQPIVRGVGPSVVPGFVLRYAGEDGGDLGQWPNDPQIPRLG
jgi:hypothetical protein